MTSHPSPFYRQRQSNKTLDPTGQTAKFLYTILKQLDLKNIDWNEVARNLDITNGHAARMRWSRFRAQIEGLDNSYSRKGGKKKDTEKKRKRNTPSAANEKRIIHDSGDAGLKSLKTERISNVKGEDSRSMTVATNYGAVNTVKNEPVERKSIVNGVTVHHPTVTTIHMPQLHEPRDLYRQSDTAHQVYPFNDSLRSTLSLQNPQSGSHLSKAAAQTMVHWPQQNFAISHGQPHGHRNTNAFGPFYSSPSTYANHHVYPNAYVNQLQQRYQYNQQLTHGHLQQPQHRMSSSYGQPQINLASALTSNPADLAQRPRPLSQPTHLSTAPVTSSTRMQNASNDSSSDQQSTVATLQSQSYACELASQASYPWPYSEASLPKFIQQENHSRRSNDDGNDRDNHGIASINQMTDLSPIVLDQSRVSNEHGGFVDHNNIARTAQTVGGGSDPSSSQEESSALTVGQNGTEMEGVSTNMVQQDQKPSQGVYIKSESELITL